MHPTLNPARQDGTRLTYAGGWEAELTWVVAYIIHPSSYQAGVLQFYVESLSQSLKQKQVTPSNANNEMM